MNLRPMMGSTLLTCVALLAGCVPGEAGDGDGRSDGGPPLPDGALPEPAEDALTAQAELYCEWMLNCDPPPGDTFAYFAYFARNAPDGCPIHMRGLLRQEAAAAPAGRWDAAAFARCRADVLTSCRDIEEVPSCRAVVVGDSAPGEACREGSSDCDVDGYCDVPIGNPECDAVCIARDPLGEPCTFDAACALGADGNGFCARAPDAAQGVCAALTIRGGAEAGAPCGWLSDAGGHRLVGCGLGAWCDAGRREAGVCQPTLQQGDPCEPDGLPCHAGECDEGRCSAVALSNEAGAACADRDLPRCNPFAGLGCDLAEGVCAPNAGGVDDPCGQLTGSPLCQEGHYCDGYTCQRMVEPGGGCDPSERADPCRDSRCVEIADDVGECRAVDDGDTCDG